MLTQRCLPCGEADQERGFGLSVLNALQNSKNQQSPFLDIRFLGGSLSELQGRERDF